MNKFDLIICAVNINWYYYNSVEIKYQYRTEEELITDLREVAKVINPYRNSLTTATMQVLKDIGAFPEMKRTKFPLNKIKTVTT